MTKNDIYSFVLKTVVESDKLIGVGVFLRFEISFGVRIAAAQTITTIVEIIPILILIRLRENNRRINV